MFNLRMSVIGNSGSGKTFFILSLLKYHFLKSKYVLIIDTKETFSKIVNAHIRVDETNYKEFSSYRYLDALRTFKSMLVQVDGLIDDEIHLLVDSIFSQLKHGDHILVVVDEAHIFLPRFNCPVCALRYSRTGREQFLDYIVITQQWIDLDLTLLKQSNVISCFRLHEQNEVQKLSRYVPGLVNLTNLPRYGKIIVDTERGEKVILDGKNKICVLKHM